MVPQKTFQIMILQNINYWVFEANNWFVRWKTFGTKHFDCRMHNILAMNSGVYPFIPGKKNLTDFDFRKTLETGLDPCLCRGIHVPANFSWVKCVRFLSSEYMDFRRCSDDFQTLPKTSEDFRRWFEDFRTLTKNLYPVSQCVRTRFEGFQHDIQCIALFIGLGFLALVRVYIFFESVSAKAVISQIFQSGVRNWSVSVSWREIKVFDRQAWESCLRRESWQVYRGTIPPSRGEQQYSVRGFIRSQLPVVYRRLRCPLHAAAYWSSLLVFWEFTYKIYERKKQRL